MYSNTSRQDAVSKLVYELAKLPGIGERTATRLAYHILKQDPSYPQALADALVQAKKRTHFCQRCMNFTDEDLCHICSDPKRNSQLICIVERPTDVASIDRSSGFNGSYHVLHGVLSPLDGVGPEDLKITELLNRVEKEEISEVILALNPSIEGDATAVYLSRLIRPLGVRTTKLAHGIPVGGQLEYTDRQTIHRALENRMEMST